MSASAVTAASAQPGLTRTLIQTGDPRLLDSPVETLIGFFMHDIAANGQVLHQSSVVNNQAGPGRGTYQVINSLLISPSGRVGLVSQMSGTTGRPGLFYLEPGSVQEVPRQGQTLSSGLTYSGIFLASRTDLGSLVQIARKGQAAPGGGTLTSIKSNTDVNDSGRILFSATQSGSTNAQLDGTHLFTGTGGALTRAFARVRSTPPPETPL